MPLLAQEGERWSSFLFWYDLFSICVNDMKYTISCYHYSKFILTSWNLNHLQPSPFVQQLLQTNKYEDINIYIISPLVGNQSVIPLTKGQYCRKHFPAMKSTSIEHILIRLNCVLFPCNVLWHYSNHKQPNVYFGYWLLQTLTRKLQLGIKLVQPCN